MSLRDVSADSSLFISNPEAPFSSSTFGSHAASRHLRLSSPSSPDTSLKQASPLRNPAATALPSPVFRPDTSRSSDNSLELDSSSLVEDTRAQFDLDIDIAAFSLPVAKTRARPTVPSPQRAALRRSVFFDEPPVVDQSKNAATAAQIENLSRQLTDCKIHLKLYEKFLQDLIDKRLLDATALDTFPSVAPKPAKPPSAVDDDLAAMSRLVEDLYANLEDYQQKWRDADQRAATLSDAVTRCASEVSVLLEKLGVQTSSAHSSPEAFLSEVLSSIPKVDTTKLARQTDSAVELRLSEYQRMIDRLQREVNELKMLSRTNSVSSGPTMVSVTRDNLEVALKEDQRYFELQQNYRELLGKLHRRDADVSELQVQNATLLEENAQLRALTGKSKHLATQLDEALENLRVLKNANTKLELQAAAATKEEHDLRTAVKSLTAKLSDAERAALDAKAHHDKLFRLCVRQFNKLMASFNKIADDESLLDPARKLDHLATLADRSLSEEPPSVLAEAAQYHKSVFDYFVRATDVIVNDHIRLLLKEGDKNNAYIQELKDHIVALEEVNRQMQKPELHSPRLKLRIEELTKRWKAEREARVMENRQAKQKLRELEGDF